MTGDFTIECWYYHTTNGVALFDQYTAATTGAGNWQFWITGNIFYFYYDGSSNLAASATTLTTNTWYHLSATRSGSTIRLFINGILQSTTVTFAGTVGRNDTLWIGRQHYANSGTLTGYIASARIIKGTALNTATFITPTSYLTAVTNTILLTCQSSTFVDTSTNAWSITLSGTPYVSNNIPYSIIYSNSGLPVTKLYDNGNLLITNQIIETTSTSFSATYSIGSAGTGGSAGANSGTAGGSTTFTIGATTITATGGTAGASGGDSGSKQTAGVTATNGDINGGSGQGVSASASFSLGGSSVFGGGGSRVGAANGTAANGYGAGGAGGQAASSSAAAQSGGNGSQGIIRIWEFT